MEAVRVGWLGKSREQALLRQCELALSRWQAQWWSEQDRLRPSLRLVDALPAGRRMQWQRLAADARELSLAWASDGFALDIGAKLLGIARHAADAEFCKAVGASCLQSLAQMLWADPEAPDLQTDVEAPKRTDGRYGGLMLAVEGLPQMVWLHVNRGWCDVHAPITPQAGRPLASRISAIAATRVQVDARIELGKVALSDSVGWQPGEVLITDESRTARAYLSVNGKALAQGRLARAAEGARAVAIA